MSPKDGNFYDLGIEEYELYEDDPCLCVYEDDEICIFEDGQLIQKTFYPENTEGRKKPYKSRCHACTKKDGVNSNDENCEEDPPYMYKCKYCKSSLRTHDEYGEGMKFDMAKKDITWRFEGNKPVLIDEPINPVDDGVDLPGNHSCSPRISMWSFKNLPCL